MQAWCRVFQNSIWSRCVYWLGGLQPASSLSTLAWPWLVICRLVAGLLLLLQLSFVWIQRNNTGLPRRWLFLAVWPATLGMGDTAVVVMGTTVCCCGSAPLTSTLVAMSVLASAGASTLWAAFGAKLPHPGTCATSTPVPLRTVSRVASATPTASAACGTVSLSVCCTA
ncbi:hypothetical protein NP493_1276g00000 [Ridgeia piscesae]|uniref:Uncharacterized protein n=1 Tax=Ridgeia piscesae TaxID=27915 RepID=A0AAD9KA57_RIDPI|nr:hypothetical protein NP493_1276g00000 [Ridgeia piscesae]